MDGQGKNYLKKIFELCNYKNSLQDLLELLEEEDSAGEEERIKLADQNVDSKFAILPVSETLEKLEAKIINLATRFPSPLKED